MPENNQIKCNPCSHCYSGAKTITATTFSVAKPKGKIQQLSAAIFMAWAWALFFHTHLGPGLAIIICQVNCVNCPPYDVLAQPAQSHLRRPRPYPPGAFVRWGPKHARRRTLGHQGAGDGATVCFLTNCTKQAFYLTEVALR